MPRPGRMDRKQEKPKNFFGSLFKIFNNLRAWRFLLIISLVLAILGAVFSVIAPGMLSDLTDEITLGIKPDTDKLMEINQAIKNNYNQEDIVIDGVTITLQDQTNYISITSKLDYNNQTELVNAFDKLP